MKKAFIVAVFAFALFNYGFSALQRRIYYGHDAEENEFPSMAAIRAGDMNCGGVLINENFVLTAAHCLMNHVEGQDIIVILGNRNYFTAKKDNRTIKFNEKMNFSIHENFSMPSAEHDIGVIQLPRPVTFSEKIKPMNISTDRLIDQRNKEVIAVASGWGEMKNDVADILQTTKMKLIPIGDCMKFQEHFVEKITERHICALGESNKANEASGPCDGDSGSPLIIAGTNELIGITSYIKDAEDGEPLAENICGSDIAPAVYVRVASYLDWISEKTGIRID